MTKKNPDYANGWHTTGTMKVLPSIDQIAARLEANPDVLMHALNLECPDGWWSYDAVWMVDGVRVRGRLNIHHQNPNEPQDAVKAALDPHTYDPSADPMGGYFHVFAEADQPWEAHWPSPLNVFMERKLRPSYVSMEYSSHNPLHMKATSNMPALLGTLAELPWLVTVLTHDDLDPTVHVPDDGVGYVMPLISRLPSSLYGRVLDVRIMGEATRKNVNRTLSKFGTHLPDGGVAILLANVRRKGIPKSDLSFALDKPFMKGGDITAVVQSLTKMLAAGVMEVDTQAIDELRKEWNLLTPEEKVQSDADRIKELEAQVAKLRDALNSSLEFNDKFKSSGEDLIKELNKVQERERKAVEREKKLRSELDRLLCMLRDGGLTREIEARQAAEENAAAAEELLDEQNHEVTRLRQENGRLRRELARLDGAATLPSEVVEEEAPPATWDDFLEKAAGLEYVVLGDVESGIDKLRRQVQEENWLNRSWEALRALDEYARLKKERGAEEVPHFRAYLEDPLAEHVIPRTRYSSTESKGVMMNSRFVAARTFPVPSQVDPSGKVVMEAHIRIGSGKPPAPRMHLHDDTSGATGKIYVGHIGPHLPNYQTN